MRPFAAIRDVGAENGGWPRKRLTAARLAKEPELAKAPGVQAIVTENEQQEADSSPRPSRGSGSASLTAG